MSHDDFILGYQNGRLGCSVSTLLILRLFLVGRIREARVVIPLVGWSAGLLLVIGLTISGFVCLPALWALLGTIILLAIFALGFVDQVGRLIVSTALIDEHFHQFALAEHALYVFSDENTGRTFRVGTGLSRLRYGRVGESTPGRLVWKNQPQDIGY
jgi:hypothetical protein